MKVKSTIYKGIEFVEIYSLPNEQKQNLLQTIDPDLFIKILVDGKLMSQCIQYKDYEEWYDNAFVSSKDRKKGSSVSEPVVTGVQPSFQV
jgi:hypothetical protein